MKRYQPILSVYTIWHPDANQLCRPLAEAIYTCLNRDPARPFDRGMGIPTFFRCVAEPKKNQPVDININSAIHTVIFVLVDDNLVFDESWADYIAQLYTDIQASDGQHLFVPIALTGSAFNLHTTITKSNFVRLFNLDQETVKSKLLHSIVHILARLLENSERSTQTHIKLSPLPIKLFISHTKRDSTALQFALALKQSLDNTQLDRFFDSVDIASGHNFDEEILANIEQSALIAIRSDQYSSSPWCRLEVMAAKRLNRPMIMVDGLEHHEDRSFPYLSNIPSIRFDLTIDMDSVEAKNRLQTVIDFALLEVLRFIYIEKHLKNLKSSQRLPQNALILSRAPEELDLKDDDVTQVVYPDPPLGFEETKELKSHEIAIDTPTTYRGSSLDGCSIGISISETDTLNHNESQSLGLSPFHLQNAMTEIARQCLAQGATLVYGGDLRANGFTENLLELVRYHNDTLKKVYKPVVNYLAWPLKPSLNVAWAAENKDTIKIKEVDAPDDLKNMGLIEAIPRGSDISNISDYVWARCLTDMRKNLIQHTQARIMMGGKITLYKGKYPGLVEEALITLQAKQPLFLLGGFGGATQAIIDALLSNNPPELTLDYQCNDKNHANLVTEFNQQIVEYNLDISPIDYQSINEFFTDKGISGLNNGLKEDENKLLFETVYIEEAIALILTGISNLMDKEVVNK